MRNIAKNLVLGVILVVGTFGSAAAQSCRPADDSSKFFIGKISEYALAQDSAMMASRDSVAIPAAQSQADLVLIQKASTCRAANKAYQAHATGGTESLSGRVYVIAIGKTYVVWDPYYSYDPQQPDWVFMVFNSHWKLLSLFR